MAVGGRGGRVVEYIVRDEDCQTLVRLVRWRRTGVMVLFVWRRRSSDGDHIEGEEEE